MDKQSIELNSTTKLRKNTFTRDGYIFKGWSRQPNGNVEYTDEQEIQNLTNIAGEKVLLYAVWVKEWYDINAVPIINATDKILSVGDNFNPLDGVTAFDEEDGEIILTEDNIIKNTVNVSKAGRYEVVYKVTDKMGASATKARIVIVNSKAEVLNKAPIIKVEDKVLAVGDEFNPLEGVTAYDEEDGEITIKDENIIKNTVDMSKAGRYEVVYKITDKMGASATKTITVIVNEKNIVKPKPEQGKPSIGDNTGVSKLPNTGIEGSLPILGILSISIGSILSFKRKKS